MESYGTSTEYSVADFSTQFPYGYGSLSVLIYNRTFIHSVDAVKGGQLTYFKAQVVVNPVAASNPNASG